MPIIKKLAIVCIPWVLACVFLFAAVMKSLYVGEVANETHKITFLPRSLVTVLPMVVPPMECLLACLILIPSTRRSGLILTCVVLFGFVLYLWWRISSGIDTPCYCFGPPTHAAQVKLNSNIMGIWRNVGMIVSILFWFWLSRPVQPKEGPRVP